MQNGWKTVLKLTGVIFLCTGVFFASAYFYLNINSNNTKAEAKDHTIPYVPAAPDNCGLLVCYPDGDATLFYLNFSAEKMAVAVLEQPEDETEYYGYSVDFKVHADYSLIEAMIDRVGGVDLTIGGETLRYTGVQIVSLISSSTNTGQLKRDILTAFLQKLSQTGFSNDDFVYIIENSETNLTVPDCYDWPDYLKRLCTNAQIINSIDE